MTDPATQSTPAAAHVTDVIRTDELERRPLRARDYRAQSHALAELAETLVADPGRIAQKLVRAAMALTGAESAGLSLQEGMGGADPQFRWVATAGEFERYLGGTLPRYFSPCGTAVGDDAATLMVDPQRAFPYVAQLHVPCREVLLAPFHEHGVPVGTLWVVLHSPGRQFDAEDRRVLVALAKFAEAAAQTAGTLETLRDGAARDARIIAKARDEMRILKEWFDLSPGFCARLSGSAHVIEAANEAFVALVGRRELLGRAMHDAVAEFAEQGFVDLLDEVYVTGKPFVGRNVGMKLRRRGELPPVQAWVDFVFQPITSADGDIAGIFIQGHDVTDGHEAIERLREADRNKDAFIATLAHELRNPLSPIKVAAQVLKRSRLAAEPELAKLLDIIDRQTRSMGSMIDGLMDMAAIRSGKVVLRRADTNLQEVAARSVEAVQETLRQKKHRLELRLPAEPVNAHVDALRLTQALTNLLANAAKYTPDGGEIVLTLSTESGKPTFEVRDNGPGIAEDVAPHLFDMFMQGSSARRPAAGLGIGLAVVRQVMQLHGGGVHVHSEGTGKGSRFSIWLPG